MQEKERLSQRFEDMGRFFAPDLCALPGILVNISREGCKIRYQYPVTIDEENDYEAKITFARAASGSFTLVCHPQWVRTEGNCTEIGFRILPSTDYTRLASYILQLEEDSTSDNLDIQTSDSVCQIIK
ncbi:MAG: PilZ domain-containing protein [Treponema sp.]|nr:PilZ domain-containing protein [Treponema sp.]